MPGASTVTAYCAGSNWGARNCPCSLVVTLRDWPVFSFFTVTVPPGITAPDASETVPTIRPVSLCARTTGRARDPIRANLRSLVSIPLQGNEQTLQTHE